jgi:hypothetical protein
MVTEINYTVHEIANLIKQMEIDLGLLSDETYGLDARYVWEASRTRFCTYLNKKFTLHEDASMSIKSFHRMGLFALICYIGRFLYSIIFYNWFWAPSGRDWLIFKSHRRRKISGKRGDEYEDIYTNDLITEIGIDKCVVLEWSFKRRHYRLERQQAFHAEFLGLMIKIITVLMLVYFKYDLVAIHNMIHDIETYIGNKTNQKQLRLEKEFDFQIKSIFASYIGYLLMLKWLKPRKGIILTNPPVYIVRAATVLQIPVIELQHGVISSDHLTYSVPTNMTKKYSPDYLLLFGKYFKEQMDNFVLPPERLIILGYPYFEKMIIENNNLNRENKIVVISQGTIGRELIKFTIKLASITKGFYKIIYKLHQNEWMGDGGWIILYPELKEAQEQGLLEVVDTFTPSLYTLFFKSRWQMGVYSTALFEGLALGCQLILVDLPGVERMTPLLEKGYAQLVKVPEEIQFQETKDFTTLREELFASDWRSNWRKFEQMDLKCRY